MRFKLFLLITNIFAFEIKNESNRIMMKNYFSLFTFIIVLVCFSCGDEVLSDDPDKLHLLKQVFIEDELSFEYTYTNAGLIAEEKSKFHYSKHTYNSANQLIQSDFYRDERIASSSLEILNEAMQRTEWVSPDNTEKDNYYTFEYHASGKLKKRTMYRLNGGEITIDTFIYNMDERIERRISYYENKKSVYDDYFYDSKGNLNKQDRYFISEDGTSSLQSTRTYEFDEKHNPYLSFRALMMPGKNTNQNNVVKETYIIYSDPDANRTMEYNYEYNIADYPVKRDDGFTYVYY